MKFQKFGLMTKILIKPWSLSSQEDYWSRECWHNITAAVNLSAFISHYLTTCRNLKFLWEFMIFLENSMDTSNLCRQFNPFRTPIKVVKVSLFSVSELISPLKRLHFDLLVQSEPGVMDLVLPRQEVFELSIIEELRKSPHIYKMDVGKRNGCFRINLPDDVISIRIYCSSSSLEAQKAIFGSLQPIFDAIKYTAVKECQIKNCTPWNDDEFILANGHSATISVIDLRSFQDEDISEVMNILVQLRIYFYFMSGKRLVIYGNGSNLVRLRLELLPFNVHLPIGQKQGASQFTLKKLSMQEHKEMRFTVKIGRVGAFHTVPVQIAIAELAEDLESGNLHESQSVKFLREQLQAQEFHIQWIESGTSNEKCLCFELDKEYEDKIPLSIDTGTSLTRITHRGPCSQPIRVGVVNKPSENRHDHWNTVFKKMSTKGDYRKNHLTFSKQSSGSIQRYNAIKSFSLDENFRRTTLIIGNEEAPFFFSDKVQVAHIGSLFDIDSKVLNNWNARSLLEYAKWDTRDRVELDVLTRSKNFYRIIQFGLPGGQEFSIARPLQRNGKWIVRHADKLILRTFERCYITIVCPPSIDHAQILYGKVDYDCIAVWILKHCPKSSSTTKNGTADKLPFEKMQNTKIDEQSESDHDDAQGREASTNATLIDATDESNHTVGEHQHSAVAPDLEEPSAVNPHRNDTSKQIPLPGIHFFDAWRIRPNLTPDPKMGEKLPSLGTEELIPEEPANVDYGQSDRADIQHRREQERDVRGATKTIAQLALEMSHVHRLADLIKEKADLLKDLAMRRKSYQDEVKESSKGKSTAVSSAPKKQRTTGVPAPAATPLPTPLPTAHGGKAMEVDTRCGTSQPSSAPFPWPFTRSSLAGGFLVAVVGCALVVFCCLVIVWDFEFPWS